MATDGRPRILYVCYDCGASFYVPQGTRRRYCPQCLANRVSKTRPHPEA